MSFFDGTDPDIDLGQGHLLWFTCWAPTRVLNPSSAWVPSFSTRSQTVICVPPGASCSTLNTLAGFSVTGPGGRSIAGTR